MKAVCAIAGRFFALSLCLAACAASGAGTDNYGNSGLNPVETFSAADAPEAFSSGGLAFAGPWGYRKSANALRLYPLVVAGYWGEGVGQYEKVAERYPAFVLEYQKDGTGDGAALADWIDAARTAGYRIDPNRVYLTGFSQGGSGSFPLARGMYNKGKYFAAIIRVAGQSQSDIGDEIASKTAIWYHLGLDDTAQRVSVARDALAKNRAYACNKKAKESTRKDSIAGHARTTVTLTRSGRPMFKYSEYEGLGHSSGACYEDETLFPWAFSQSLE